MLWGLLTSSACISEVSLMDVFDNFPEKEQSQQAKTDKTVLGNSSVLLTAHNYFQICSALQRGKDYWVL